MKAYIFAIIIFSALLATVIGNSVFIGHTASRLKEDISSIDYTSKATLKSEFERIYADYKKHERFISLTVSHDDLTNIEESFADIIGAIEAGDESLMMTAKSRLEDALSHLRRLSGINPESIF